MADEKPYSPGIASLFEVVARLRAPGGCPWDREQTHESLRPYLLEETYELLEAIDAGDDAKMKEELGDLLLRVGFDYASMADSAEAVAEEARELADAKDPDAAFDELGDLLFAVVSLSRRLKVNPEDALRVAGQRFRERFAAMESQVVSEGKSFRDLDSAELARRWDEALGRQTRNRL